MRELLDSYANGKGYARFVDMPADVLDVNDADRKIGDKLHYFVLYPLAYAKGYVEKRPDTDAARNMALTMAAGREARRKMERQLRRFLQAALGVWEDEWMPALLEAQAIARDEHREDEAIGPTFDRLAADGRLRLPSSWHIHELGRAIQNKDFAITPTTGPWPATRLKAGHAELRPADAAEDEWTKWQPSALGTALQKMEQRLASFGPGTRDVYTIMLGKWVEHKTRNLPGNPWIGIDEILELRNKAKKLDTSGARYGFADRDRWEVREAIEALANIHVSLKIPQAGKHNKVIPYRGHFVMLGDRRGQPGLGGEASSGSVAAFTHIEFTLPALARQGIEPHAAPYLYLHIQALQYTGKQALEKAVAYYLAELSRINASRLNASGAVRVKVATLLDEAGMTDLDPRKAAPIRDRLHTALNTLADDGLIVEWKYADAAWEQALRQAQDAGKRPRGWANEWLEQIIEFTLPQEPSYRSIAAHRQERRQALLQNRTRKPHPTPPPAEAFTLVDNADTGTLAAQVAATIHQQGLSKADAATAIGITRPTLNALLDGKPTRANVRQRAGAWLHTTKGHPDA